MNFCYNHFLVMCSIITAIKKSWRKRVILNWVVYHQSDSAWQGLDDYKPAQAKRGRKTREGCILPI